MADTESPNHVSIGPHDMDQDSQKLWNGFTRFLVITVITVVVALLIIAAFTVWS
ncbi:MAG TPA: hypothetical protein VF286_09170 [Acidiphilium sp.]